MAFILLLRISLETRVSTTMSQGIRFNGKYKGTLEFMGNWVLVGWKKLRRSYLELASGASSVTANKAASVHWNPLWFAKDFLQILTSLSKAKGMSLGHYMMRTVRLSARF